MRARRAENPEPPDATRYQALAAVAREPFGAADVADRAGTLAADIRCLYLNGIPRPYHYGVQPSGENRLTFEAFLTRIAARSD